MKENTDGDERYCQGHDMFTTYYLDKQTEELLDADLEASNLSYGIPDDTSDPDLTY